MMNTTWAKSFLRLLPALLLLIPFGIIKLVTPKTASFGILIAFYTNIPSLGMFASLFGFYDFLSIKMKLVNDKNASFIPI